MACSWHLSASLSAMTEPDLVRRLTAIMDIDVVGFSTMSARDKEHALSLLGARMAVAQGMVKHHRGRVFKLTGDGFLADCAGRSGPAPPWRSRKRCAWQTTRLDGTTSSSCASASISATSSEDGDDLMGDAVDVAARLKSIANPGGICVSPAVYKQIEGKLTLEARVSVNSTSRASRAPSTPTG